MMLQELNILQKAINMQFDVKSAQTNQSCVAFELSFSDIKLGPPGIGFGYAQPLFIKVYSNVLWMLESGCFCMTGGAGSLISYQMYPEKTLSYLSVEEPQTFWR